MIYDLTHAISEELPVYPGDPNVKLEPVGGIEQAGFLDHLLTMDTHNGTHIDAPAHMIAGGKELKAYSIDQFIKNAVCIDAAKGCDAETIASAINEEGLAVLFCTGASNYFYEERYWREYPVLDAACIKVLIDKKVSMVGVDAGSFDKAADFPVHRALLGAGILLIENLTGLAPLAGKTFDLYALPLKLEKDGAPARVIAVVGQQ